MDKRNHRNVVMVGEACYYGEWIVCNSTSQYTATYSYYDEPTMIQEEMFNLHQLLKLTEVETR